MKNLTIVALAMVLVSSLFAVETVKDLTLTSSVGFENEYVFRGKHLANRSIQASVDASYKLYSGSVYGSVFANLPAGNYAENQALNFSVGYKLPVFEKYTVDFGGTYYWHLSRSYNPGNDREREIYTGVTYNGLYVNPAIYVLYNFDLDQVAFELSGAHSFDLAKVGVDNTTLDIAGKVGTLSACDFNGDQSLGKLNNGYPYYATSADVVYHFTKSSSASVGVRLDGNYDNARVPFVELRREATFFWGMRFTNAF